MLKKKKKHTAKQASSWQLRLKEPDKPYKGLPGLFYTWSLLKKFMLLTGGYNGLVKQPKMFSNGQLSFAPRENDCLSQIVSDHKNGQQRRGLYFRSCLKADNSCSTKLKKMFHSHYVCSNVIQL